MTITQLTAQQSYSETGILRDDSLAGKVVPFALGANTFSLDLNYTSVAYESVEMYTVKPMTVVMPENTGMRFYLNGEEVTNGAKITLNSIGKQARIQLVITDGASLRQYQVKTMPTDFPSVQAVRPAYIILKNGESMVKPIIPIFRRI